MERAGVLIQKLLDQYQQHAGPEQLLLTLQMLQQELIRIRNGMATQTTGKKITVILPSQVNLGVVTDAPQQTKIPLEEKIIQVLEVDEKAIEEELEQIRKSAELKNQLSLKSRQPVELNYDPLEEVPTLATQSSTKGFTEAFKEAANGKHKEINETIPHDESSLNDYLKEEKKDLSEKLQGIPIKDLKKAIGINDRYLFINELFNGDEVMYERSVKTINSFSIYAEADFWMERELKVKLGWKDENELAQQFFQLVRRRFS